jgi:hypothetical protein
VPAGQEGALAEELATQLGRGELAVQRSLSRSIVALGEPALPALRARSSHRDIDIRIHAVATERLVLDPEESFDTALAEAKRLAR